MNNNHIKSLINLGFLVDESTKSTLEKLSEEDFYKTVENLKRENIFIITNDIIKKFLTDEVKILKTFKPNKKFTIQDYVKMLNERYNNLQEILVKKLELTNVVSINKCSSGYVSVIGFVKEKEEKNEELVTSLEDQTGEIKIIIPKNLGEKLMLDDIVAVSGNINNKILFAEKLFYPDVPLRPVNYTSEPTKIAFLTEHKKVDAEYVVYKNKIEDKIKNKKYEITNPCVFEVGNVVILFVFGYDPLDVLRKRYINIENSDFIIEISPDILFTDKDINTNYKGISIVSLNKIIDLKTREVQNI